MGGKQDCSKLCPNCTKSLYNHQRRGGAQKWRGTFAYMATPYCDFTHFQYSFSAEGACQKFKKWRARARVFFQIRKASFSSFSAVSTNFKILQILRNAGRPPASNSIESRSVWPRKRRKPQLSRISKSPAANPSPYPLPLTLTPWNRKEWRMKNEEW